MSDKAVGDLPVSDDVGMQAQTAGALLRRARESAGLHVAALAVSMKVPVKKLEALEADRLDLLPDAVFVRALASSVCRTLKIDAAPVLKLLPQTSTPRLDAEERGINTPFHAAGDFRARALPEFITRPAVIWVAALLLGVVVVAFFPETKVPQIGKTSSDAPAAKEPAEIPAVPAVAPAPVQANAPSFAPVPDIVKPVDIAKPAVAVTPEFSAPVLAAVATTPATANVVKMPVVAASTPTANPITSGASGAAGAVAGVLTLKAKGTTWVEVTDAKGVVQVRKTLALGEVAAASGVLPLSVVVGRADMTLVEVRGQSFSLDAISKDNVARFEVK